MLIFGVALVGAAVVIPGAADDAAVDAEGEDEEGVGAEDREGAVGMAFCIRARTTWYGYVRAMATSLDVPEARMYSVFDCSFSAIQDISTPWHNLPLMTAVSALRAADRLSAHLQYPW